MPKTLLLACLSVLLAFSPLTAAAQAGPTADETPAASNAATYQAELLTLPTGEQVKRITINSPPHPPAAMERPVYAPEKPGETAAPAATKTLSVPKYEWTLGCSATSAAMIAAYYDRNGYPNMYTGPTGGGVMPLSSTVWGTWTDSTGDKLDQCPLAASRNGLDGRTTRGSVDDYWVAYYSYEQDPYITGNWQQHTYGDAIGDYMKTSQSAYDNFDGATSFAYLTSKNPLTCAQMAQSGLEVDGTYGIKRFYEARGYTVSECYAQATDNVYSGGFSFAQYKAEIDAGRPVMLNLVGHTVVGVGYNDTNNTVQLHDTWDQTLHTMTWGGTYSDPSYGMEMEAVSIVKLACPAAADVTNPAIAKVNSTDVKLTWSAVTGAVRYEVWSAANAPYFTPGANCASPAPYTCQTVTDPTLTTAGLGSTTNNYSYAVRAVNGCGAASAAVPARVGEFEFALVR